MAVATIQLHLGISENDRRKIKEDEERTLTPQMLQDYLDGFDEELDKESEDYLFQVVRLAYLTGF